MNNEERGAAMPTRAEGAFEVKSWEEDAYGEPDGALKFTRASTTNSFEGGLEGESSVEYLMVTADDGRTSFVGLEHVAGSLLGRPGSFAILHNGTFEAGNLKSGWSVVAGSGTGDLRGLRGSGTYLNEGGQSRTSYEFDHHFE